MFVNTLFTVTTTYIWFTRDYNNNNSNTDANIKSFGNNKNYIFSFIYKIRLRCFSEELH